MARAFYSLLFLKHFLQPFFSCMYSTGAKCSVNGESFKKNSSRGYEISGCCFSSGVNNDLNEFLDILDNRIGYWCAQLRLLHLRTGSKNNNKNHDKGRGQDRAGDGEEDDHDCQQDTRSVCCCDLHLVFQSWRSVVILAAAPHDLFQNPSDDHSLLRMYIIVETLHYSMCSLCALVVAEFVPHHTKTSGLQEDATMKKRFLVGLSHFSFPRSKHGLPWYYSSSSTRDIQVHHTKPLL
jgi:hypothetical protein